MARTAAVPAIALDAVVIDTETTGLDPRKARVVEIAAVRLVAGRLGAEAAFRQLVRPGATRFPAATRACTASMMPRSRMRRRSRGLAGRPRFPRRRPPDRPLGRFRSRGDQARMRPRRPAVSRPRTLDTRLLAQVAAPELAGYTLEKLAAWLDVDVGRRHSALGDAITTARIFLALVPRLRERGIRTLAEAERGLPRADRGARRSASGRLGRARSTRRPAPMPSRR